jgi:hypothetical protein
MKTLKNLMVLVLAVGLIGSVAPGLSVMGKITARVTA